MAKRFLAVWHERSKIQALIAADPDEDRFFDIAERNPSSEEFKTLDEAVAHLVAIIKADRDCFGQAEVREINRITDRCGACTCNGWQIHKYIQVDDRGICGETPNDSECLDEY